MASEAWAHVHALPTADEVDLWEKAREIVVETWEDEGRAALYPVMPDLSFADFDAEADGQGNRQYIVRVAYNRHVGILENLTR